MYSFNRSTPQLLALVWCLHNITDEFHLITTLSLLSSENRDSVVNMCNRGSLPLLISPVYIPYIYLLHPGSDVENV